MIVWCEKCVEKPGTYRAQMTAYTEDHLNYGTFCEQCQKEVDEYWQERWDEYWKGCM